MRVVCSVGNRVGLACIVLVACQPDAPRPAADAGPSDGGFVLPDAVAEPDVVEEASEDPDVPEVITPEDVDEPSEKLGPTGPNKAPIVTFESPIANHTFNPEDPRLFVVQIADDYTALVALVITWSSDQHGALPGAVGPDAEGVMTLTDPELKVAEHVVTVKVTDQHGESTFASVKVTMNAAPSAPVVSIKPELPGSGDDLSATIVLEASDPNANQMVTYIYEWKRNGQPLDMPGALVPAVETSKGEIWRVTVTPTDGFLTGTAAVAQTTVGNGLPSCTTVGLDPPSPAAGEPISCICNDWVDPDEGDMPGDTICQWLVSGQQVAVDGCTAPGGLAQKGDTIQCVGIATDGLAEGVGQLSPEVVIGNAAPTVVSVGVAAAGIGDACDTFACQAQTADADDDEVTLEWAWFLNGDVVPGAVSPGYDGPPLNPNDVLACQVTPADAGTVGEPAVSDPVAVAGTASLPMEGKETHHEGLALWNVTGAAPPEGIKTGHALPPLPCIGSQFSQYYLASRDYESIDGLSNAGLRFPEVPPVWSKLTAAMAAHGLTPKDLKVRVGLMTLGADVKTQDWGSQDKEEWRRYTGGPLEITVAGEAAVGCPMPPLTMMLDYGADTCMPGDDLLTMVSDFGAVSDLTTPGSSEVAQAVATAVLQDLSGAKMRFAWTLARPLVQPAFNLAGRSGIYLEVTSGALEKEPCVE